jgi:hypothetical protein
MLKKPEHSTIVMVVNFEDDIHCMPQDDWFEHMPDANCPRNPILDEKNKVDILRGLAQRQAPQPNPETIKKLKKQLKEVSR